MDFRVRTDRWSQLSKHFKAWDSMEERVEQIIHRQLGQHGGSALVPLAAMQRPFCHRSVGNLGQVVLLCLTVEPHESGAVLGIHIRPWHGPQ